MRKLLTQRAIYNYNSDIAMFKILDEMTEEQLNQVRGGCITGDVDSTVTTLDLIAHNAYVLIYLYKIFEHKAIVAEYDQKILDYELKGFRALSNDSYEALKELTLQLDEVLIKFMETIDFDSYDSEDFTVPDLSDFISQTAAGWIEHLLAHQVHHRGQISQITSELNIGTDISQFRLFGY